MRLAADGWRVIVGTSDRKMRQPAIESGGCRLGLGVNRFVLVICSCSALMVRCAAGGPSEASPSRSAIPAKALPRAALGARPDIACRGTGVEIDLLSSVTFACGDRDNVDNCGVPHVDIVVRNCGQQPIPINKFDTVGPNGEPGYEFQGLSIP